MNVIIKKSVLVSVILFIVPMVAWVIQWKWQFQHFDFNHIGYIEFFYWMTESASYPWAIITCFILLVILLFSLKTLPKKQMILLSLLLAASILVSQGTKSALKKVLNEPRPFVVWLEDKYHIDDKYFYSLSRDERANILSRELKNNQQIPRWMLTHWKNETGYSLPSGHTLFASFWLLLFVGLLNFKRNHTVILLILIWALIIEISRLLLGMHWPLDLAISNVIALIFSIITCYLARRWCLVPV